MLDLTVPVVYVGRAIKRCSVSNVRQFLVMITMVVVLCIGPASHVIVVPVLFRMHSGSVLELFSRG